MAEPKRKRLKLRRPDRGGSAAAGEALPEPCVARSSGRALQLTHTSFAEPTLLDVPHKQWPQRLSVWPAVAGLCKAQVARQQLQPAEVQADAQHLKRIQASLRPRRVPAAARPACPDCITVPACKLRARDLPRPWLPQQAC